jgi:hypothetical protein
MEKNATTADMNSLVSCSNKLVKDGFTDNFKIAEQGLLSPEKEKVYKPDEVEIVNFYRFEGASDPADNAILYAIKTNDGSKGTLSDSYGPYADPQVAKFIQEVENISKKTIIKPEDKPETLGIP